MNDSCHFKNSQDLNEAENYLFELLAVVVLQYFMDSWILFDFVDPLAVQKLAFRLKHQFAQRNATEFVNKPQIKFVLLEI